MNKTNDKVYLIPTGLYEESASSPEDEFARAVIYTERYAVSKTSETLNSRKYNA